MLRKMKSDANRQRPSDALWAFGAPLLDVSHWATVWVEAREDGPWSVEIQPELADWTSPHIGVFGGSGELLAAIDVVRPGYDPEMAVRRLEGKREQWIRVIPSDKVHGVVAADLESARDAMVEAFASIGDLGSPRVDAR